VLRLHRAAACSRPIHHLLQIWIQCFTIVLVSQLLM
jgi:hypothetical protein